jgi:glyoxylase-like metal-dependent hydrolase (beta-lactamase superfamily II)
METTTHEIADGIHRISTFIPEVGLPFNQYLVVADEPLLFHTGMRQLFPLVSEAVARIVDPTTLRHITFGHYEADECGAMNQWLAVAPRAEVVHGNIGVLVSLNDAADRPPRALADGEVVDLGGKRVRRTSLTAGTPGSCTRRPPGRSSSGTCSPRSARPPRCRTPTSSGPRPRPRTRSWPPR